MKTKDLLTRTPYSLLFIVAVIFLVYGQILTFSLGKLDEYNIILVNLDLLRDFANLKTILTTNPFFNKGGEFYRPLQNFTFMLDAHLSGEAGWGYYLTNILLHSAACSLLWYVLIRLRAERRIALLIALIYAVHPLFIQTVAWSPSRGDMLITVFGLLSFASFIGFARNGSYGYLLLHIASYLLALFSKESAILIPVVCYLWYFILNEDRKITPTGHLLSSAGYLLTIGLFFYLRSYVIGIQVSAGEIGFLPLIGHLRAIPELIFKFVIPVHLSPMPGFLLLITVAGLLVLCGLIFMSLKNRYMPWKLLLFGLGWFLLFLGPTLVFTNKYGSLAFDYMEHRGYLPLAGVAIILALWISERMGRKGFASVPMILAAIVFLFGFYNIVYSRNYKDAVSFFGRAVESNPGSAVAWYCRGTVLIVEANDCKRARPDLDKALELYPGYAQALLNRGYCKEQEGDLAGAVNDYKGAAKSDPATYEPHAALSFLYTSQGLREQALTEYSIAIALNPLFYEGFYHRALIKMELNNYPSALADLDSALRINDKYAEAYLSRGIIYFQMNDLQSSLRDLDRAILLDPSLIRAHINRGVLRFQAGDFQGALADLDNALELDSTSAEALLNRGRIFYQLGRVEDARSDWRRSAVLGSEEAGILLEKY